MTTEALRGDTACSKALRIRDRRGGYDSVHVYNVMIDSGALGIATIVGVKTLQVGSNEERRFGSVLHTMFRID